MLSCYESAMMTANLFRHSKSPTEKSPTAYIKWKFQHALIQLSFLLVHVTHKDLQNESYII